MLFQWKKAQKELAKLREENEALRRELLERESRQQKQWENFWMYDGRGKEGSLTDE